MAHAVQICDLVANKLVIDTQAFNLIMDQVGSTPVAIYSLCGQSRKGKSFMLSMWVRYLVTGGQGDWVNHPLPSMFTYRHGSNRETTGIYMWSSPFIFKKKDGSQVALLLLDSQGSFDQQTTTQGNAVIFALCTLLSSHVTYNLQHEFDESLLQFIQYFASFARLAADDGDGEKDEPFQKLLFLIRDFAYPREYDYGYHDERTRQRKNYMMDKFINVQEPEVKFNRSSIISTFSHVGVFLMPAIGDQIAFGLAEFSTEIANPDFVTGLEEFVPFMLSDPEGFVVKRIGGQVVTGDHLRAMMETWSPIFQSTTLPEAKTVVQATAEIQHEMAKGAALENYSKGMKDLLNSNGKKGVDPCLLETNNRDLQRDSIALFKSWKKIGAKELTPKYLRKVEEEMGAKFDFYKSTNDKYIEMEKARLIQDAKLKEERLAKIAAEQREAVERLAKIAAERREAEERLAKIAAEQREAEEIERNRILQQIIDDQDDDDGCAIF